MAQVTIDRELLERIDESAICDGTDATISNDLFTELVAALAAPVQGEAVAWAHCDTKSYLPYQSKREAERSMAQSTLAGSNSGPHKVVPLYTTPPRPAEVGELVEVLRDVAWCIDSGPSCQIGVVERCKCAMCVTGRIRAALAKLEGKA